MTDNNIDNKAEVSAVAPEKTSDAPVVAKNLLKLVKKAKLRLPRKRNA